MVFYPVIILVHAVPVDAALYPQQKRQLCEKIGSGQSTQKSQESETDRVRHPETEHEKDQGGNYREHQWGKEPNPATPAPLLQEEFPTVRANGYRN